MGLMPPLIWPMLKRRPSRFSNLVCCRERINSSAAADHWIARCTALSSSALAADAWPGMPRNVRPAVAIPRWAQTAMAPVGSAMIARV